MGNKNLGYIFVVIMLMNIIFMNSSYASASSEKIRVAVSIQSLGGIVRDIVGGYAEVIYILPSGAEPHSYQLPPSKLSEFEDADLLVLTGHFRFEETIEETYPNKLILTLNSSSMKYGGYNITVFSLPGMEGYNPHGYWIYPDNALSIAKAVADKMIIIDSFHKEVYKNNLLVFEHKIASLKEMYLRISKQYKLANKPLIIGFPAEQYFVAPLNMSIVATIVKGGGLTISGKELQLAREKLLESDIPIIIASDIARTLSSSSIFDELSSDTGAEIAYVNIVGSSVDDYFSLIYYNLGIVKSTLDSKQYYRGCGSGNINSMLIILSITLLMIIVMQGIYIVRLREI